MTIAKRNVLPSQEKLKEHFDYNPDTGIFSRKNPNYTSHGKGEMTGTRAYNGYRSVKFEGTFYYVHRLIWKWMTNEDPGILVIDHIDGNPENNSFDNLRVVTFKENANNRSGKSRKVIRGVHYDGNTVYTVSIASKKTYTNNLFEACCIRKSYEAKVKKGK